MMNIEIKIKDIGDKCKLPSLTKKRTYLLPISEEFDKDLRVWNEFAGMVMEDPNFFDEEVSEIEKQYIKYEEEMDKKLISFLEKSLNIKIDEDSFYWESFVASDKEEAKGILHKYTVTFDENNS